MSKGSQKCTFSVTHIPTHTLTQLQLRSDFSITKAKDKQKISI